MLDLARRLTPKGPRQAARRGALALAGWIDANLAVHTNVDETNLKIRSLIDDSFPRTLVDVGAYDGISLSNSRELVLEGWRALLIEPHPRQFAKLRELYSGSPHVTLVEKACSDRPGVLPLYLGADGPDSMMSTLSTDQNRWMESTRSEQSIEVEVRRLDSILDEVDFPADFGVLMVDGEGMDHEILVGTDLSRHRPRLLITEEYIANPQKHRDKYRLLLDQGYTFCAMIGSNTLWIRNEWVATCLRLA